MSQISTRDILKAIRKTSEARLANFLNESTVTVEETKKSDLVYNPWMVFIMISGTELRISLKIHFKMEQVKEMASPLYGIKADQIVNEQVFDFVRELSNLIGMAVKADLGNQGITTEASLPVGTRGWEEIFLAFEEQASDTDAWSLVVSSGRLELSANVERFTTTW